VVSSEYKELLKRRKKLSELNQDIIEYNEEDYGNIREEESRENGEMKE